MDEFSLLQGDKCPASVIVNRERSGGDQRATSNITPVQNRWIGKNMNKNAILRKPSQVPKSEGAIKKERRASSHFQRKNLNS